MDSFDDGATSSYNGMILAVQKRLSKGLLMNANYTWSHCIGDLSIGDSTGNAGQGLTIANNRRYDRSNCQSNEIGGTFSSDRRHIFNLTAVYLTPRFSDRWTKVFLSDWKVSGIFRFTSAYWITPYLSSDIALNGDTNNERPVQVLSNPLCGITSPSCWINPKAFVTPAPGTLSGLGRNNIPGPNFTQIDMSLSREFSIREGYRFEVRADAFNLPNSFRAGISPPSLAAGASGVNTTFGSPTFGQITSALDPRIIQLAMKFSF